MTGLTLEMERYDEEMETVDADDLLESQGPLALLGGFPDESLQTLLEYLPSRPIADRLVTKFFPT